jgi:hypothetical protein
MHVIRLRGPWRIAAISRFVPRRDGGCDEVLEEVFDDLPTAARATMPANWSATLGRNFIGRVRYTRSFHRPTGLDAGERVFLIVEPPRSSGVVELNRKRLGDLKWGAAPLRVDVTNLLGGDEELEIIVEHASKENAGGLVGEVWLEIED